jgi:D-alanine-D-alanine ligase
MNKKIKVAIIFGGKSAEHEVSLQSAKSIIAAIDKNKYELQLIGIDKSGKWFLNENSHALLNEKNPALIQLNKSLSDDKAGNVEVAFVSSETSNELLDIGSGKKIGSVDVAFPMLHGTFGEDGTIRVC